MPLPRINERFHAFGASIATNTTERSPARRPRASTTQEDQTLFGIRCREPRQGARFEADAGLRLTSPLDPFVKGSWR